jgi:hypothetical protein
MDNIKKIILLLFTSCYAAIALQNQLAIAKPINLQMNGIANFRTIYQVAKADELDLDSTSDTHFQGNKNDDLTLDLDNVGDRANSGGQKIETEVVKKLRFHIARNQWIEARTLIKKLNLSKINDYNWKQIRRLIHSHPQIGWDLTKSWDMTMNQSMSVEDIELQKADKNMLSENFYSAFMSYQKLAVQILKMPTDLKNQNMKLYWTLVHSMARAAYGAGNFDLSLQYYQKISTTYELFRQVQFEKMWSAYRANKIEMAIGAVSSQASAYFSSFFEPETYLLQFYIFKRMCRDYEISKIKQTVYELKKNIDKNKIKDSDWLAKDIETLLYKQILIHSNAKNDEKKYLLDYIRQRKAMDLKRIKEQMEDVVSFIEILSGNKKALAPIYNKFQVSSVINSKLEKWNVEDTEEWIDDLGKHIFIGQSECKK